MLNPLNAFLTDEITRMQREDWARKTQHRLLVRQAKPSVEAIAQPALITRRPLQWLRTWLRWMRALQPRSKIHAAILAPAEQCRTSPARRGV